MKAALSSFVLVLAALSCIASEAAAQQAVQQATSAGEEDARALFLRGQTAYAQGDYEEAAELWERAYRLDARVGLQYNLSQAYERLGRLEEAAAALERYVTGTSPEDERLSDARARLAALRERIARTAVRLRGGPEGAALVVDGEDRGRLPRPDPLPLSPGSHEIRVRAPGYAEFAASVAVPAGQVVDVGIEMQPVASAGGVGEPSLGSILTMAGGGVVLVTGLVVGGVALDQAGRAPSRNGPEADSARTLAIASDVLWPIGATALGAGLVWLVVDITSGPRASERAQVHVAPLASPAAFGAALAGTF